MDFEIKASGIGVGGFERGYRPPAKKIVVQGSGFENFLPSKREEPGSQITLAIDEAHSAIVIKLV